MAALFSLSIWCLAAFPLLSLSAQQFNKADNLAPYVPAPQAIVDQMLETGRVKPGETVYDLGCGDGRIVITAAQKFKAKAVGVEISRDLYRATSDRVKSLGLENQVKILHDNMLRVDLSPADVVTLFLLTSANDRLRPNLEKYLKPGARVVSLDFPIRGWKPSGVTGVSADGMQHTIFLYEVSQKKNQ